MIRVFGTLRIKLITGEIEITAASIPAFHDFQNAR